jgi:hypothetical protein
MLVFHFPGVGRSAAKVGGGDRIHPEIALAKLLARTADTGYSTQHIAKACAELALVV